MTGRVGDFMMRVSRVEGIGLSPSDAHLPVPLHRLLAGIKVHWPFHPTWL